MGCKSNRFNLSPLFVSPLASTLELSPLISCSLEILGTRLFPYY